MNMEKTVGLVTVEHLDSVMVEGLATAMEMMMTKNIVHHMNQIMMMKVRVYCFST